MEEAGLVEKVGFVGWFDWSGIDLGHHDHGVVLGLKDWLYFFECVWVRVGIGLGESVSDDDSFF